MQRSRVVKSIVFVLFLSFSAGLSLKAESEIVIDSANVVQSIVQSEDRIIPKPILEKCVAIAVFPSVKQGGFFVGGLYGEGLFVLKEDEGSWSEPLSITITGGSIGYQFGFQASDMLFFILSSKLAKEMVGNKTTLGVDTSVAAGPFGKNFLGMTDTGFTKDIYIYSNNRGIFAGISLGGAYFEVGNEPIVSQTEYALKRWNEALLIISN